MSQRMFLPAMVVLLIGPQGWAAEDPAWRLEMGASFSVKGKFVEGKDLSAAAGFRAAHALVASDETRGVQAMSVDPVGRVVTVGEVQRLLPGEGTELDIEGIAAAKGEMAYYMTGSHSLSRKKQRVEASRSRVFMVPADGGGGHLGLDAAVSVSLRPLLQADPVLKPFLDQPATANGVDIEGLGFSDGRLFFGLRAPSINGKAFVLEVVAQELFAGRRSAVRHELALGEGQGIREIVALHSGGFLVLAGPCGSEDEAASATAGGFTLWWWAGPAGGLQKVGALPAGPGKAEGMFVFGQTDVVLDGLIFYDGAKDGAPQAFRLVKSPP